MNYGKPAVEVKVIVQKHEDIPLKVSHIGEYGFKIYDCLLSDDEYIMNIVNRYINDSDGLYSGEDINPDIDLENAINTGATII